MIPNTPPKPSASGLIVPAKPVAVIGSLSLLHKTRIDSHRRAYWLCQCICGEMTEARIDNLNSGRIQSCGCQKDKTSGRRNQLSSHRLPPGVERKYAVKAFLGLPQYMAGKARSELCFGFCEIHIPDVDGQLVEDDTDYLMTSFQRHSTIAGQVHPVMKETLNRMRRDKYIGAAAGRSYPKWAAGEGVDYAVAHVTGYQSVLEIYESRRSYCKHGDIVI